MSDPYIGLKPDDKYEVDSFFKDSPFGKIYFARNITSGEKFTVQFLSPKLVPGIKTLEFLSSEVENLMTIRHHSLLEVVSCGSIKVSHSSLPNFYMIESGRYEKSLKEFITDFSNNPYSCKDMFSILSSVLDCLLVQSEEEFVPQSLNPRLIEISKNNQVKLPLFNFLSSIQWVRDHSQCSNISAIDLRYIAPEMIKSHTIYPAEEESLSYFFGVLAFEMATGVAPFEANRDTVLSMHLHDDPPAVLNESDLPSWFNELVYRCLSKDASARPALNEIKSILEQNINPVLDENITPPVRVASNYKVLFVEDNRLDQLSFARHAKNEKYLFDYNIAHSVSKAEQILREKSFDCVVSDYMLPDGTAIDIINLARPVPTIVVSGAGKEGVALSVLREGAQEYISKDIKHEHLHEIPKALEKVFRRKTTKYLTYKVLDHINSLYCIYSLNKAKNGIFNSLNGILAQNNNSINLQDLVYGDSLEDESKYIESISSEEELQNISVDNWEEIITEILNIRLNESNKVFKYSSVMNLNEFRFDYSVFLSVIFSSLLIASRPENTTNTVIAKFNKKVDTDKLKGESIHYMKIGVFEVEKNAKNFKPMSDNECFYKSILKLLSEVNNMNLRFNENHLVNLSIPIKQSAVDSGIEAMQFV